jgi:hypothetical protein
LKCSETDEWVNKCVSPHNGIFLSYKKEWSTDTHYIRMNLENIVQSERSQSQKRNKPISMKCPKSGKVIETKYRLMVP